MLLSVAVLPHLTRHKLALAPSQVPTRLLHLWALKNFAFVPQRGSFKPFFGAKVTAQIAPVLCKAFQLLTLFRLAIARPPLKGIARTFVQWLLLCVPALFRHLSGGIWHIITVHPIKAHLWLIYPVGHSRQGIYHPHERRLNGAQDKCTQVAMSGIVPTPKRGRSTCLSFQSATTPWGWVPFRCFPFPLECLQYSPPIYFCNKCTNNKNHCPQKRNGKSSIYK